MSLSYPSLLLNSLPVASLLLIYLSLATHRRPAQATQPAPQFCQPRTSLPPPPRKREILGACPKIRSDCLPTKHCILYITEKRRARRCGPSTHLDELGEPNRDRLSISCRQPDRPDKMDLAPTTRARRYRVRPAGRHLCDRQLGASDISCSSKMKKTRLFSGL